MRTGIVIKAVVAASLLLGLFAILYIVFPGPADPGSGDATLSPAQVAASVTPVDNAPQDRFFANNKLTVWWDRDELPGNSTVSLTGIQQSNIHPDDYSGADACKKCHPKKFEAWSNHSHRWMNALATTETVRGDFSGREVSYLGGTVRFATDDDGYRMEFERDAIKRVYRITQTIGWRFFQYYVGHLESGPEPKSHPVYSVEHVLLFGYWLDRDEWIPAVHVGYDEAPDGEREDPFAATLPVTPLSPYFQCNSCHTTFALGDELTRNFYSLGRHPPHTLHWDMPGYLAEHRSDLLSGLPPRQVPNREVETLLIGMQQFEAPEEARQLGVTCEACHLGSREHAEGRQTKPSFFPVSEHLHVEADKLATGREHENVNWVCGRCHAGERPYYAAGMSTWNSTEYTDATKGGCYSQLTCIDCHDPHTSIGPQWTQTERQNDESCLKCHEQLRSAEALQKHSHHAADSEGSRCMNCHMPRLNEGLQEVVRTHMIFSPTNSEMIESNQLNACNICHVEESIDWTTGHLEQWYGAKFNKGRITSNYAERTGPTATGWLKSENEAVRLAATDAVGRSSDTKTVPALIDILDDPYLLNRQFARVSIERRFQIQLADFGYQFYMTPDERREPIGRIRQHIMEAIAE